jgi:hypothetical protein
MARFTHKLAQSVKPIDDLVGEGEAVFLALNFAGGELGRFHPQLYHGWEVGTRGIWPVWSESSLALTLRG